MWLSSYCEAKSAGISYCSRALLTSCCVSNIEPWRKKCSILIVHGCGLEELHHCNTTSFSASTLQNFQPNSNAIMGAMCNGLGTNHKCDRPKQNTTSQSTTNSTNSSNLNGRYPPDGDGLEPSFKRYIKRHSHHIIHIINLIFFR